MYHTVFTVMSVRNGFLWLLFDDFGCSEKRLLKILTRCSLTGHTNIQAIQVLNENSRKNLFHNFSKVKFVNCMDFFQNFLNILFVFKASKKHVPWRKENVPNNQIHFLIKELSQAMMARSTLFNNFLKNRNDRDRRLYMKQRNYWKIKNVL